MELLKETDEVWFNRLLLSGHALALRPYLASRGHFRVSQSAPHEYCLLQGHHLVYFHIGLAVGGEVSGSLRYPWTLRETQETA